MTIGFEPLHPLQLTIEASASLSTNNAQTTHEERGSVVSLNQTIEKLPANISEPIEAQKYVPGMLENPAHLFPSELRAVVDAWAKLPENIRAAILALAEIKL